MANYKLLLLAFLCLALGCSRGQTSAGALRGSMHNLGPSDERALQEGRYRVHSGTVMLSQPLKGKTRELGIALALSQLGFNMDLAVLRNPGVLVLLVSSRQLEPISRVDKAVIAKTASEFGATQHSRGLPIRFGPDGRTPLVMKNVVTYSPAQENRATQIDTLLAFPSEKEAKQAAKYVDPHSYVVDLSGKELRATCIAPQAAATDEWTAFAQVAAMFGGKVKHVSASIEHTE